MYIRIYIYMVYTYIGFNSFPLLCVRGSSVGNQWKYESILQVKEEMMIFRPLGANIGMDIYISVLVIYVYMHIHMHMNMNLYHKLKRK
jgi:hypothetical protein